MIKPFPDLQGNPKEHPNTMHGEGHKISASCTGRRAASVKLIDSRSNRLLGDCRVTSCSWRHDAVSGLAGLRRRTSPVWVANKDLVELELRTYLSLRPEIGTYEVNLSEITLNYRKNENCCIWGKSRKKLVKTWQIQ